jgi:hypothetical protein
MLSFLFFITPVQVLRIKIPVVVVGMYSWSDPKNTKRILCKSMCDPDAYMCIVKMPDVWPDAKNTV